MANYLVNIGLVTSKLCANGAQEIPFEVALNVLDEFVLVEQVFVHGSDTEPTLVARVTTTHLRHAFVTIANILAQDCIAVYDVDSKEGALIGKNTVAWGAFNPEYFLTLDGSRLG